MDAITAINERLGRMEALAAPDDLPKELTWTRDRRLMIGLATLLRTGAERGPSP